MKKYILTATTIIFTIVATFGQDCKSYFPMKEGVKFETTAYNAKGKESSKALHTIINYEESDGNMTADVRTKVTTDDKKQEPIIFEYQAVCEDGQFKMNRFGGVSSEQLGMMDGNVDVDGDYLMIPDNPEEGQMLPDGKMTMTINASGMEMKIKYDITNRKVDGFETVETSAGSFDALKISYTVTTKIVMKVESQVAEWFVEGVGVVKSEQYNKKGKLQGYSLLTSLEGI